MPFDTLSPRLKAVATASLSLCRNRWGHQGLRKEEPIDGSISWRPTYFLKPSRFEIIAVEVDDKIYTEVLKSAAHDIGNFDHPITVYQASPLDVFQNDPRMARIGLLRDHGFGIITVDDEGNARIQHTAQPLAQNILPTRFESDLSGLTQSLKIAFRAAYVTFQTNVGQGLQQAGQIVEGMIGSICSQAEANGTIATSAGSLADKIDLLYQSNHFRQYRGTLGGVRSFVREFRNTASHAPRSAKEAAEKIRNCKDGFLTGLRLAKQLREDMQRAGYIIRQFVP